MERISYAVRDDRAVWNGRTLAEWVPLLVDAVVESFDPVRVVLFGSVADRSDGPDSDIDLLVVLQEAPRATRRQVMVDLRRSTRSIAAPHDILVTDVADFERNQHVVGTTEFEPAHRGIVLYERNAA